MRLVKDTNVFVAALRRLLSGQHTPLNTFRTAASQGKPKHALALLDELDKRDARKGIAATKP